MALNLSPAARKQMMDVCAILGVPFSTHDEVVPACLKAITERLAVIAAGMSAMRALIDKPPLAVRTGTGQRVFSGV